MTDDQYRDHGAPPLPQGRGRGEYREFRLTNFALQHRTSILMLVALTAILGIMSYRNVPKESSPEITIPLISVSVIYPGVGPATWRRWWRARSRRS